MWPFEHWDNGKVYLHIENWLKFKEEKLKHGEYPHNWDHKRIFCKLINPRDSIYDIPTYNKFGYEIESIIKGYRVIYEP
jgi:hypothetical protein